MKKIKHIKTIQYFISCLFFLLITSCSKKQANFQYLATLRYPSNQCGNIGRYSHEEVTLYIDKQTLNNFRGLQKKSIIKLIGPPSVNKGNCLIYYCGQDYIITIYFIFGIAYKVARGLQK